MNAEFEEWCSEVVDMGNCTYMCSVCEACWQAAQSTQKRKDAEIAKHYLGGIVIAKAIEEQEGEK